jgi:hypothetical protein
VSGKKGRRARQRDRREAKAADDQAVAAAVAGLEHGIEDLLGHPGPASWRTDCTSYSSRTTGPGDVIHRCKLGAAGPTGCPDDCPLFEASGPWGLGTG